MHAQSRTDCIRRFLRAFKDPMGMGPPGTSGLRSRVVRLVISTPVPNTLQAHKMSRNDLHYVRYHLFVVGCTKSLPLIPKQALIMHWGRGLLLPFITGIKPRQHTATQNKPPT
jgi:hypothetical protein